MEDKWYVAKLIMRCRVANQISGPWTVDEQIRVLLASDDEMAFEKAHQLGRDEEHTYDNEDREPVYWEFVGVAELEKLMSEIISDGTEITYHLFESDDPSSLVPEKRMLQVFWAERNRHRTVREILEQHDI